MQHSGIDPIDGAIGGLAIGRVHILTGAPGAGKSAAGLQFLTAGLRRGEPSLLLTTQDLRALRALALHMGVDLRIALLEERLVLLRYGAGFARRLGQATTVAAAAVGELRAAIASLAPTRLVIDSVLPFLDDGSAAGSAIGALAELLASTGATTLVTCPGDLTHAYDRRLDALVQSAAAVIHLAPDTAARGISRVEVVKGPAISEERPRHVAMLAGRGLVAAPPLARAAGRARTGTLLLLHESPMPEPEMLALLERDHAVRARPALGASPDARDGVDAVVIEVSHHTLDDTIAVVHALTRQDGGPPVLTFARFNVRSADRARLLRAGADDTLAGEMSAAELRHRLAAAIARGHVPPGALLPAHESAEPGSVVELLVDGADLDDLTQLVMRSMRAGAGDRATRVDGVLLVYLHGARRRDTSSFVERIRTDWGRRPRSPLRITVRPHPSGVADARVASTAVPA